MTFFSQTMSQKKKHFLRPFLGYFESSKLRNCVKLRDIAQTFFVQLNYEFWVPKKFEREPVMGEGAQKYCIKQSFVTSSFLNTNTY